MANARRDTDLPQDETATRRAADNETVLQGQKRALELCLHGAPLSAVLDVIVRTVEEQSASEVLGSILLLDADAQRLRHGAAPNLPADYYAAIDGVAIGPAVGSCGTAAFTGETVVAIDVETDPRWVEFKTLALSHGLRACWSKPILSSHATVLGTFALYHRVATTPSARDREIVELMSQTAAVVLERESQARRQAATDDVLRRGHEAQSDRLQAMFECAPAAIAVLRGPEHRFEVANPKYRELVGGRPVLGKTIREAFPDLEGQGIFELLDGVRAAAQPYVGRSQPVALRRGPDDQLSEGYFDFVYQPVVDADGQVDSILVVAFEVTELVQARLEAEAARARAEASEHALKSFVDHLPVLAWTARPDGHIDHYNQRWYEYTGATFDDMQGWGWESVHDPESLPVVVARWRHSLITGEPFEMEFTLRGADGVRRWFLTRATPSRDASGRILRWFGMNTDIQDIKSAQALSTEMAEQSRDTQRRLLELRTANERAEARIAELEAEKRVRA
jgi:PAS domain S-box-containing protein